MNFNSNKKGKPVPEDLLSRLPALSKRISKERMNDDSSKSPTNAVAPPISISQLHSDKDFNFTMKLSQNLIVQTRKLQAENKKKDIKIVDLNKKIVQLTNSVSSLQSKVTELSSAEQQLDETNWELNLNYQENISNLNKTRDINSKLSKDLAAITYTNNELSQEVEELRIKLKSVNDTYSNHKNTTEVRIHELESQVDELNTENNDLSNKISNLQDELTTPISKEFKSPRASMNAGNFKFFNSNKFDPSSHDFSIDSESKNIDAKISLVAGIPLNNIHLESQTLKSNLDHAHHVIAKLRTQLLKYRKEDFSGSLSSTDPKIKDNRVENDGYDHHNKEFKHDSHESKQKKYKFSYEKEPKGKKLLSGTKKNTTIQLIDHETDKLLKDTETWLDYESDTSSDVDSEIDEGIEVESNDFDNFGIDGEADAADPPTLTLSEPALIETESISSLEDIEDEKEIVNRYIKKHNFRLIPVAKDIESNPNTYLNLASELETNSKNLDDEILEITDISDEDVPHANLSSELKFAEDDLSSTSPMEILSKKLREPKVDKEEINTLLDSMSLIAIDVNEFNDTQKLLEKLQFENNSLDNEVSTLREKLKLFELENEQHCNNLEETQKELKAFKDKFGVADLLVSELSSEITSLKSSNSQSEAEVVSLTKIVASLKLEMQDLTYTIDNLKFKNNSTEKSFNDLSEDHATLKSDYNLMKKNLQNLAITHKELQNKHDDIISDHDELKKTNEELTLKFTNAVRELDSVSSKHLGLKKSNNAVLSDLESKKDEINALNDSLKLKIEIISTKEEELCVLQSKFVDAETRIGGLKEKLDNAEISKDLSEAEFQKLRKSHENLRDDLEKLNVTSEQNISSKKALDKKLVDMKCAHEFEISALNDKVSDAESKYDSLKMALQKEVSETKRLTDLVEETEAKLAKHIESEKGNSEKISLLETKLSESKAGGGMLSENIDQLKSLNEDLESKICSLQSEYSQTNNELLSLKHIHDDVKSRYTSGSTKLLELEAAHQALKEKNKEFQESILNLESENKTIVDSRTSTIKKSELKRKSLDSKIAELADKLSNSLSQQKDLTLAYEKSKKEIADHTELKRELTEKIAKLVELEKSKTLELKSANASYQSLSNVHNDSLAKHKELQLSYDNQCDIWSSKLADLENKCQELTNKNLQLAEAKKGIDDKLEAKKSDLMTMESKLQESEIVVANNHLRISELEKSLAEAVNQTISVCAQKDKLQKSYAALDSKMAEQLRDLNYKLVEVEASHKELSEANMSLNESVKSFKKINGDLEKKQLLLVEEAESNTRKLNDEIECLKTSNTELDQMLNGKVDEIKDHTQKNSSLMEENASIKRKIIELTKENKTFSSDLDNEKSKIENHIQDKEKLLESLDKVKLELTESKNNNKKLNEELKARKLELDDNIKKNAEFGLSLRDHKKQLADQLDYNKLFETEIKEYQSKLESRIIENDSLSSKNDNLEKELTETVLKHHSLADELEKRKKDLDLSVEKYENLVASMKDTQSKLDATLNTNMNISEKFESSSKELTQLALRLESLQSEHAKTKEDHALSYSIAESLRTDKELLIQEKKILSSEIISLKESNDTVINKLNETILELTLKLESEIKSKVLAFEHHKTVSDNLEKTAIELESTRSKFKLLNDDNLLLKDKAKELEEKRREANKSLASIQSKHNDLLLINTKLSDDHKMLQNSCFEMEKRLAENANNETKMNHKFREMGDVILGLRENVLHFTKEHELNEKKVKDLEKLKSETGNTIELISKKLVDLEASHSLLLSDKEMIEKQRSCLKIDYQSLLLKHENLQEDHTSLAISHSKLKNNHDTLNELLDSKTKYIEELSNKLIDLESKYSTLNAEYNTFTDSRLDLEAALKSKTEDYEKLSSILKDKDDDSDSKDALINILKQRMEELVFDNKKHMTVIELKEQLIESLKEAKLKAILEIDLITSNLGDEINAKEVEISKLKSKEVELLGKFDLKAREYDDLYELNESQRKTLDKMNSGLNSVSEKYESVLKLNQEHLSNNQEISIENDTLQAKLHAKVAEFEKLSSIHADRKKELNSVAESYKNTSTKLESRTNEVKNLQNNLESLQKKLEFTEKELLSKDKLLKSFLQKTDELESSVENKNNEIEALNCSLSLINREVEEFKKKNLEVANSQITLKEDFTSKSKELSIINEKHEKLLKVNASLQEELSDALHDNERVSKQLEDNCAGTTALEDIKSKLEAELKCIQKENTNSKKLLKDHKTQIADAQEQLEIKEDLIENLEKKIKSYVLSVDTLNETLDAHVRDISSHKERHENLLKQLNEKQELLDDKNIQFEKIKSLAAQFEKNVVEKDALIVLAHSEIAKFKQLLNQKQLENENTIIEKDMLINELKKKQKSLEEEIIKLTSELADLRSSYDTLTGEISVLTDEYNETKKQYIGSLDDANQLNSQISVLNESIDDLSSRLTTYSEKNNSLQKEVDLLAEEKVKAESAMNNANEDIISLKNLIEDLKKENRILKTSESSLATNLLEVTASLDALKHAHTELTFKHDSLQEHQRGLAEKDIRSAKKSKEFEDTIFALNKKHSDSENLVSILKIENDKLSKELAKLESMIEANEDKYAKFDSEKQVLTSTLQKLQDKNDSDEQKLAELKVQVTNLTISNELVINQSEKYQSELDKLIKNKADLDTKFENLNSTLSQERACFSEERESSKSTIDEFGSVVADYEAKTKSFNESHTIALNKIEELSSTIVLLESENEKLAKENESNVNKYALLEKDIEKLSIDEQNFVDLTEKFKNISLENTKLLNNLKQIQEDYGGLESSYKNKVSEIDSMTVEFETKMSSLKLQNSKVQMDYNKTFADYNSLFNDHSKLNDSFKELTAKHTEATAAADELKNNLDIITKKQCVITMEKNALGNQLNEKSVMLENLQDKHLELSKEHHQLIKSFDDCKLQIDDFNKLPSKISTIDELKEKAKILNFTLVPSDKYATLSANNQVSRESLASLAKGMNLLVVPETAYVATNMFKTPDSNNVIVLPKTYYNKLSKNDSLALYKVGIDKIEQEVRKRGFSLVRHENQNSHFIDLRDSDKTSNSKEGADSKAYKHMIRDSIHPINGNIRLDAGPKLMSSNTSPKRVSKRPSSSQFTNKSIVSNRNSLTDASIAMISLATEASLNEPSIIAAVAQTVIGEFLHKYYRRLGPLSVISETRHERYFWVHPYTMTLYWSTENPVQGNPSEDKTRAAALVGVESVDDNNPLPTGLYHKSIIVHTNDKDVKITCPSRIRHNIWYNSLKYLIHRNSEGLDFS